MEASLAMSRLLRRPRSAYVCSTCRRFGSSPIASAGHSKWSTIKHDKARNDKVKSKERAMMSKEISNATQLWGPDTKFNPRLTLALSNAKRASIPKIVIESAIARGQGLSVTGQALEPVTIEAMLPGSVAMVVECQTDQKATVLQDIRHLIKTCGGIATSTTFLFEKKGRIAIENKEGINPDDYLDQAIEAGAIDLVVDDKTRLNLLTDPQDTKRVGEEFARLSGLTIEELEIFWDPNQETLVEVQDDDHIKALEDVLSTLRDNPAVQGIYLNTVEKY